MDMQLFFDQIKIEMANQTKQIISQIDEKLVPFTREIEQLKSENKFLKEKISSLEKNSRTNNLIIYGLKENERSSSELVEILKDKIKSDLNILLDNRDINIARRIGKINNNNGKERPVLVSFVNNWQKLDISKNRKKLKNINISEDYPKEVLEKRKELKPKLLEERKNGNYAVLNYDKLVVKKGPFGNEKRKRDQSTSPATINQPKKQNATTKTNRLNAFDMMRGRSNSFSTPSSSEQKL
ncbi:unnamed protein product [Euphydryas editha]|uniref:Endonuclease-reverse transcriptase n=1 Tax=Euphydryas editha TaxID=104508 RepID=A0AAU9TDU3_EUPED|nr:unnamed protein product [Euphydryas editha]